MKLPTEYSKLSSKQRRAVREAYIIKQQHKCMHCGVELDDDPPKSITSKQIFWGAFPPGFKEHPIHLQHNHDTDMTEGAVHMYCNAVLWQYHGR